MPAYWYAINSHPHKEDALYRQVQSQGIEAFYPCVRVNPVNPRSKKIRPYFPGYLFVHVDLEATGDSLFQWLPHARGPARGPNATGWPVLRSEPELISGCVDERMTRSARATAGLPGWNRPAALPSN